MLASDIDEIVARLHRHDIGEADFAGKRVVISGCRGFLGQTFTSVFYRLGAKVVGLDRDVMARRLGAAPALEADRVEYVSHDVTTPFPIHGAVDYVLSLAAIASPVHYAAYPLQCFEVIIKGTQSMLELAAGKNARFFLSSTSELYGNPIVVPSPEYALGVLDPYNVRGQAYDIPKLASEGLTAIYARTRQVDTRIVRYFNVYGSGMAAGDYRVMAKFAAAVLRGEPLRVFGSGDQTRSFCHLVDAIVGSFLVLVKGTPGKPYNVGNPQEVTLSALAHTFAAFHPLQVPVQMETPPAEYKEEPRRRCPNINEIRKLGFEPEVPIEVGVSRFLEWADTQESYLRAEGT